MDHKVNCKVPETAGYQASHPSFPIVSHDTIIKSNSICPMVADLYITDSEPCIAEKE